MVIQLDFNKEEHREVWLEQVKVNTLLSMVNLMNDSENEFNKEVFTQFVYCLENIMWERLSNIVPEYEEGDKISFNPMLGKFKLVKKKRKSRGK
jgi:hypothetical protein